ncbi:hypothetical protein [Candidatus Viadribacter manganicus]|uniref:Uncharacterized protein n=1 Tax=Candidatus Viadribacter manganicus TaxID=1759059 RepID=A0A1B1AKT4_9PROT|nr:hypothetical protein [Candidatus Viadribacter manganicus]ANP47176.1 hypothetical protein ATE48_15260 [Candidatus Viadribacter manganicus]
MSKVIVERPRVGRAAAGLRPGRTRMLVDDDGEPIRAKGAREPQKREQKTKHFNETLNPLKRYLASNVGRPWDKVYSEICEHLKPSSTVQQHVRDHLQDFVAMKTRTKAGVIMATNRWGGERPLADHHCLYYVHPRTKLLRKNEHYQRAGARWRAARTKAAAEIAKRLRVVDEKTQLHLFDGAWWEVKLAKIPLHGTYTDVVHGAQLSTLHGEALYARHGVYARDKRQLSKAEIKKLKLRD